MTHSKPVKGTCLCKSITITAEKADTNLGVCHCNMCRKWSAGPFLALDCGTDVEIDGKEHVSVYNSSDWAERGFCKKCGTNLFYKLKEKGQYIVSSEIFNETELRLDHEIFIDEKPNYYDFASESKKMTGAEVFAAFGASE